MKRIKIFCHAKDSECAISSPRRARKSELMRKNFMGVSFLHTSWGALAHEALCLLLAGSFLLLTACAGGEKSPPEQSTGGRYAERDISPPIEGSFVSFLAADESIVCFPEDLSVRWDSGDGGETWTEKPGFSGIEGNIRTGTLLDDGSALVFIMDEGLYIITPEGGMEPFALPETDGAIEKGESVMVSLLQYLGENRFLISYTAGGIVTQIRGDSESAAGNGEAVTGGATGVGPDGENAGGSDNAISGAAPEEDGTGASGGGTAFSTGAMESRTLLCDLEKGTVAEIPVQNVTAAVAGEGSFYVMDMMSEVTEYSLEDGKPSGSGGVNFSSGSGGTAGFFSSFGASGGGTLARDRNGMLYAPQGTNLVSAGADGTVETVLDGVSYSIGSPRCQISSVFALSDGSLVIGLAEGEESRLYKYVWDDEAQLDPEKALTVWSLEDNGFVRAAIAELRKKHPDSDIKYEVALDGESAVSADDAIKSLNTRLLGGDAPDIILLDGTPAQSYAEKGMLMDLNGLADTGAVYENLLAPFTEGGGLYYLPMQLYIPALMGEPDELKKAESLDDLVSLVVNGNDLTALSPGEGSNPFGSVPESERAALYFSDLGELCDLLWVTGAPEIIGDNVLNTELLRDYLKSAKAVSDKYKLTEESDGASVVMGVSAVSGGVVTEVPGSLIRYTMQMTNYGAAVTGSLTLLQMMMDRDNSSLAPFPGLSDGVWKPSAIVGISADTPAAPFAAELINTMLSDEVQQLNYNTGMPVTRTGAALQKQGINDDLAQSNRKAFDLDVDALIGQLKTPSMSDTVITEMIWVSVEKYCKGQTDLEGAVKEIEQNVKNYLAERT